MNTNDLDPIQLLELYRLPYQIVPELGKRAAKRRKEAGLTQKELAKKSGVSLGSLRRFEQTGDISLRSLVDIAQALGTADKFDQLFSKKHYNSIEEILNENNQSARRVV